MSSFRTTLITYGEGPSVTAFIGDEFAYVFAGKVKGKGWWHKFKADDIRHQAVRPSAEPVKEMTFEHIEILEALRGTQE